MKRVVLLALFALVFAGCAESSGSDDPKAPVNSVGGHDMLSGWVLDPSVTPIAGATLTIQSEGLEAVTSKDGHYAFSEVPYEQVLVVVVQAEGFQPSSKSLTILPDTIVELNFTLERVPVTKPYYETLSFQGHLGCDVAVRYQDTVYRPGCSSNWPEHNDVWDFLVDAKLAGVVIETYWDAGGNPGAEQLRMLVETVGYGDFDEVLADVVGPSPLRAQIPQVLAQRFYAGQGGTIRVTTSADIDVDANESGVGAAAAIEQTYEVFAFPFYIAPPPPNFTVQS